MKILFIILGLQLGGALFAQEIIVFAKGDSFVLGATNIATPNNSTNRSFLSAFQSDLAVPVKFKGPDELSDLPEFGRKVPGATGEIRYHKSFLGGLVVEVTLAGLTPDHKYILTLNGNPERAGNDKLMETVDHNKKEKYYDFQTITTDAGGRYHATYDVVLAAGKYDVRFYVKDTTDFKIVLYHDFFKFAVK
jgi:hypothetical protein